MLLGLGEMSSMEAPTSPLDGTILKLPGKLDSLLRHSCTLPKGVADEIPLIKQDLEKIVGISSNLQEEDQAMMVRCWRKEVRELSYDMEDFLDQYEHATAMNCARSIRVREITRRRNSKKTLPWIREKLRQRLWMANKIREFSKRAQEALERHRLYNLDAIAGSASFSCTDDAYPTSWNGTPCGEDKAYVGIDAAMEKLEELLMMTHDQGHQKLQVVSIVGFGGIGKTTLAMELYRKLGQQFECRAFVRSSQKPDMRRIFISMLSQVRPHQPPDNWTVHGLISTIRTHLQDKRYLIIVEDLWTTSTWDIVKHALPESNCCSRILTTTEFEDLALQSCDHDPKYVYKMQPLGEDNSRKLFLSSVFGPQDECPPELREISHDIIRKCGGLPLAIVTVASILSSQPGKQDRWDYVNKAIGYSLLTNPTWEGMKQIFELSYNNLPQHLKACILYTGLYEEDIVIWKDDLINQWLAEGFIQATEGQDKKEIARSFFDRLINGKLILPVDVNRNGEVLSCTIHHMVLNLVIRCKSIEENFVIGIHHSQATTTLTDKVRRLSLQFGNAEDAITPPNMRLSHVRTLAFWGVFKCLPSDVQFRLLQVLILHFWGDKDSISFDITTISELFRLRYLKVTSNVTLELRTQMRGLKSLETLTIDARVSSVPSDIVHLPGLQHLSLPAETNLPSGIGHMTSLRMLGCFDISSNSIENVQSLSMLTNLGDLQLTCSTVQIENLNIKMQLLLNSVLGRLSNLKSLTLASRAPSYAKSFCATGMTISGGVSSLSSAPALLRSLEVSPQICIFVYTPKWIGQLRELCVLKFGVRRIDRDGVDVLKGLPALSVLTLYVQTKPAARIVIGKTGFPVIKYFRFKCCDALLEFEEGAMPNLRKLKLAFNASNADQQSTIPVGIEYLSELKEVSAKIGGVGPEESHRRAAELAFRDAIRVHAGFQRVSVQCVKQIIECKDDQSSVTTVGYSNDHSSVTTVGYSDDRSSVTTVGYSPQYSIPREQLVTPTPYHDRYNWRQYGQKGITNTQFSRSNKEMVPVLLPPLDPLLSPDANDAAMAEAMLAVISTSSSSVLPTPSTSTVASPPGHHHHHSARWWPRRWDKTTTAFRAYNAALAPRPPWRPPGAPGQRMIKMGISFLRRMHMLRFSGERSGGTARMQRAEEEEDPPPAPMSSQLNHMISERWRRERLNESFEALTALLPPGSKAPPIEPLDNQLSLDDLDVIKVIRNGSSGNVQLVRHKFTGQFFAVKIIQLNIEESIRRQIAKELKISLSTQCQYIVVFYQCFYFNGAISIVLEYMDGGSLSDFLKTVKTIPEDYLAAICKQILKGLMYLHHERRIIHRDLKPSNILINHRGEVKLADFGVSAIISSSSGQRDTFIGTRNYMAPERINGKKHGYMSDIWSLGLVILECATGNFPFPPYDSFYEILVAVVDQPPPSAPADQFSPEFCSFISACIQKDAKDRSSAPALLNHPYLSMYDDLHIDLASYFTTAGSPAPRHLQAKL